MSSTWEAKRIVTVHQLVASTLALAQLPKNEQTTRRIGSISNRIPVESQQHGRQNSRNAIFVVPTGFGSSDIFLVQIASGELSSMRDGLWKIGSEKIPHFLVSTQSVC